MHNSSYGCNNREERSRSRGSVSYRDEYSCYINEQPNSSSHYGQRYENESSCSSSCSDKFPTYKKRYDDKENGYRGRNYGYLEDDCTARNRSDYHSEEYYGDHRSDKIKKNDYNTLIKIKKILYECPGMPVKEFHEFLSYSEAKHIYSEISDCFIQIDQKIYPRECIKGSDHVGTFVGDSGKDDDSYSISNCGRREEKDGDFENDYEIEDNEDDGLVPLVFVGEIKQLFGKHPNGIYLEELPQKYEDMFGRMFNLRSMGYHHLLHFVCSLSYVFRIYCTGANGKYVIVDTAKCDDDCDYRMLQRTFNQLKKIVNENVEGIDMNDIELIYKKQYGRELDVRRMGFDNVRGVCEYLDESVIIREENDKEIIVRNTEISSQDDDDETDVEERKRHENELSEIFPKCSLSDADADQVSTASSAEVKRISHRVDGGNDNVWKSNVHPRQWWPSSCPKTGYESKPKDNKENHIKNH